MRGISCDTGSVRSGRREHKRERLYEKVFIVFRETRKSGNEFSVEGSLKPGGQTLFCGGDVYKIRVKSLNKKENK